MVRLQPTITADRCRSMLMAPSISRSRLLQAVSSPKKWLNCTARIVNPVLLVRRLNLSVNHLVHEEQYKKQPKIVQLDLFTDFEESERQRKADLEKAEKERRRRKLSRV